MLTIGQSSADVVEVEPLGVDAVEPVRVDPALRLAHLAQVVGQVHHAALAEQDVVVQLLPRGVSHSLSECS